MRGLISVLAVAAVLAILAVSGAAANTCGGRYVHAVVGGQQKCLGSGEYCARRFESVYVRHGFVCERVHGTLRLEHE
jgi:hypothetical protein